MMVVNPGEDVHAFCLSLKNLASHDKRVRRHRLDGARGQTCSTRDGTESEVVTAASLAGALSADLPRPPRPCRTQVGCPPPPRRGPKRKRAGRASAVLGRRQGGAHEVLRRKVGGFQLLGAQSSDSEASRRCLLRCSGPASMAQKSGTAGTALLSHASIMVWLAMENRRRCKSSCAKEEKSRGHTAACG